MADSSEKSSDKNESLDLEQLRDLSFAPQWSSGGSPGSSSSSRERKGDGGNRPSGPSRDRRPTRKAFSGPDRSSDSGGGFREKRGERPRRVEPYRPVVQFSIYPEDEPFDLLAQSIRSSLKVYELFEVSHLILDKTDRMVVVVSPLSDESPPLYECLPDRQLFRDEASALQHSANLLLPTVFEEREEEVEPPSGNISSVLRCKITGKYLPPRSYHRFQTLLQEHHRLNCPDASLDRVEKGLESVADPEAVQEWLKAMSRRSVFRLRSAEGEKAEAAAPDANESNSELPKPEANEEVAARSETEGSIESTENVVETPIPAEETSVPEEESSVPAEETPETKEATAPPAKDSGLVLDSREAAVNHLIRTQRETLVRETRQARVPARALAEAEDDEIRKSFHAYVEEQKRFPLETANNVRMKLRKTKFFIFKKGKKGISYVSAVRRRHRPEGAVFADSVEKIISILETTPNLKLKALPGLLFPDRVDESGKAVLQPDETRQLVQDLKWLKSEGYVYEYGDGSLEIHPKEAGKVVSSSESSMKEEEDEDDRAEDSRADSPAT